MKYRWLSVILNQFINYQRSMKLTCPECKNDVDTSLYPNVAKDQVVECDVCGITLLVTDIADGAITTEVMDEGK